MKRKVINVGNKILVFLLLFLVAFSFSSCSSTEYYETTTNTTAEFTAKETTQETTTQPPNLSEECTYILAEGYSDNDYYELVANQIDGYPDSTFEVGVIKNNKWLVKMSKKSPFLDKEGWWKGIDKEYEKNTPDNCCFEYLRNGCFYFKNGIEVVYNTETNISFDVVNFKSLSPYDDYYSMLINDDGEFLACSNDSYTFSYFNVNTGESKPVPLELTNLNNNQYIGPLSEGLFYAYAYSALARRQAITGSSAAKNTKLWKEPVWPFCQSLYEDTVK